MKKLFLFVGVIISCLLFSCKKDSSQPSTPPPVNDSLPIPFSTGTWWRYQDIGISYSISYFYNPAGSSSTDTIILLRTVIGKAPFANYLNSDTVNAFLIEEKNLTQGTLDTLYAFYDRTAFFITTKGGGIELIMKVPILEGAHQVTIFNQPNWGNINVINNVWVGGLNQNFENCIYYRDYYPQMHLDSHDLKVYIKPGIGFVDWESSNAMSQFNNYSSSTSHLKLLDYHIAP